MRVCACVLRRRRKAAFHILATELGDVRRYCALQAWACCPLIFRIVITERGDVRRCRALQGCHTWSIETARFRLVSRSPSGVVAARLRQAGVVAARFTVAARDWTPRTIACVLMTPFRRGSMSTSGS